MVSLNCVRCLRYAGKSREGEERARGVTVASDAGSLVSRAYSDGCSAQCTRMLRVTAVQPVSAMVSARMRIPGRLAAGRLTGRDSVWRCEEGANEITTM